MNDINEKNISKKDFIKLKEKDVMFITNPGRMGDEDGSTFVIKKGKNYIIYRIDGLLYNKNKLKEDEIISLEDLTKQFPKFFEAWKNGDNEKYKYVYMGFGNGLCVDKTLYNEFEPYFNNLVDEYLKDKKEEDKESLRFAARYIVWKEALTQMFKDKN